MGVLPQAPTTPTSMPEKEIVVPLKVTTCEDPQWLEEATHEPLAGHLIVIGRVIGQALPVRSVGVHDAYLPVIVTLRPESDVGAIR